MFEITTSSGKIHCWELVDGQPVCLTAALLPTDLLAAVTEAKSLRIRTLLEEAVKYRLAKAILQPKDADNNVLPKNSETQSMWDAYDNAQAYMATVSLEVLDLVDWQDNVSNGSLVREFIEEVQPNIDRLRATLKARVEKLRDDKLTGGFTVLYGPMQGKVLQTKTIEDRTNWLTSASAYSTVVALGEGSNLGATFRTEDNATFTLSFSDGLNILMAMAAWGSAVMKNSWVLKDAINEASTVQELLAINVDSNWL